MFKISEGVKKFGKAIIDNYQDWRQGEYEFINKKTRLSIWTKNGPFHLRIEGQHESFWTYRERKYLFSCIQEAIRLQIEDKGYMNK